MGSIAISVETWDCTAQTKSHDHNLTKFAPTEKFLHFCASGSTAESVGYLGLDLTDSGLNRRESTANT